MEPSFPSLLPYSDLAFRRRLNPTNITIIDSVHKCTKWHEEYHGDMEDFSYREVLKLSEFSAALNSVAVLRQCMNDDDVNTNIPTKYSVIHPDMDGFTQQGFMYLAYRKHAPLIDEPSSSYNPLKVLEDATLFLQYLHDHNCIHGNVHAVMLTVIRNADSSSKDATNYAVRILGSLCRMQDFKSYSDSWILCPLQIILEMLSSNIEATNIDYQVFKERLNKFWAFLIQQQFGSPSILQQSKTCFSYTAGARDFMDYCISRYCVLSSDGKSVLKDKSKALGYLKDIDLFALAISVYSLIELNNIKLTAALKKALGTLISGEYISVKKPKPSAKRGPPPQPVQVAPPPPPMPTPSETIPVQPEPEPEVLKEVNKPSEPPPPTSPVSQPTPQKTPATPDDTFVQVVLVQGSIPRKARITDSTGTSERVVRSDGNGDYVMWRGTKVYCTN